MELERVIRQKWKDAEVKPRYKIGEISRLFGIHPQTLRFYEEKRIISPDRSENSKQRKYSNYDMYQITLQKQYQNMGFSYKETEQLIHESEISDIKNALLSCHEYLENERIRLFIKEQGTKRLCEIIDRLDLVLHHCIFMRRPKMRICEHHINGEYNESDDSIRARQILMETMPLSFYLFDFLNSHEENESDYCWYVAIEEKYANITGFDKLEKSQIVPEANCIYTIFSIEGSDAVNNACLDYVFDFIKKNSWKVDGKIYGSAIMNTTVNGVQKRYFEAWIPVKEE